MKRKEKLICDCIHWGENIYPWFDDGCHLGYSYCNPEKCEDYVKVEEHKGDKFWCCLSEKRRLVGEVECRECDMLAGLPIGSYMACEVRKPYKMPIVETLEEFCWWVKLLWTSPRDFPYILASETFRKLGQRWGFEWIRQNGKIKRRLLVGLK